MTVAELKALLLEYDDARLVIIQKDSEGNGYSPLAGAWVGAYHTETTWSGYAGPETKDEDGYVGSPALVLVPVN